MPLLVKNGEIITFDSRLNANPCSGDGAVCTKMKGHKLLEDTP